MTIQELINTLEIGRGIKRLIVERDSWPNNYLHGVIPFHARCVGPVIIGRIHSKPYEQIILECYGIDSVIDTLLELKLKHIYECNYERDDVKLHGNFVFTDVDVQDPNDLYFDFIGLEYLKNNRRCIPVLEVTFESVL